MKKNKFECPLCAALIDCSQAQMYEIVKCHDCWEEWEYTGHELIEPEELELGEGE